MSGGRRILSWGREGLGLDPGVGVPDPGSEPGVGLGAPSAWTGVGGGDFWKIGVGAECWML